MNAVSRNESRCEEGKSLDMVPMEMGDKQVENGGGVIWRQGVAEITKPRPRIAQDIGIGIGIGIGIANLDARRIPAIGTTDGEGQLVVDKPAYGIRRFKTPSPRGLKGGGDLCANSRSSHGCRQ
jgi:hypothetical protein